MNTKIKNTVDAFFMILSLVLMFGSPAVIAISQSDEIQGIGFIALGFGWLINCLYVKNQLMKRIGAVVCVTCLSIGIYTLFA